MGTLLDTTVFIEVERATRRLPARGAMEAIAARLEDQLGAFDEVGIAAITASELLHGVHRASTQHRGRREAFVEAVLASFPVLPFDLLVARVHARLWAGLAKSGKDVGAHDRIVAATAISVGWRVLSSNARHFERIPGVEATAISLS